MKKLLIKVLAVSLLLVPFAGCSRDVPEDNPQNNNPQKNIDVSG